MIFSQTRCIVIVALVVFNLCNCSAKRENIGGVPAEEAVETFHVAQGFTIELVASEPLVSDPVAMEVDPSGNIYVVEMHGYPLDVKGSGVIKMLVDTNGDGFPDRSHIFADGLILPNGILCWKNGILVTDPPHVLYLEDTDGDHVADIREIVLSGFSLSNPQHNANTPVFGLDNWIYIAHEGEITPKIYTEQFSDTGSIVRFPHRSDSPSLPRNANGRSVRFKTDTYQLEMLSGESQFGHTFSPYGDHINTSNADHLFHEVLSARYLSRNPNMRISNTSHDLPDHGNAAEVFPKTKNPEHQLLTDVGVITSSCGVTWYGGGLFPAEFNNVTFIAEPVHNLVHADKLTPQGASFIASRLYADHEFIASTDSWSRPVNFYNGPDGALYMIDYYRQVIEHPEWMSEEMARSGALYNGSDMGRIYRIVPSGANRLDWCGKLDANQLTDDQLADKLDSPMLWWRKTAQRLLLHRQPKNASELLRSFLLKTNSPYGWLHALWLMEGLGVTDPELLETALSHVDAGVRRNAIRIAEMHLNDFPQLLENLLLLQDDNDAKVRFQLVCTLGDITGEKSLLAKMKILEQDLEDRWVHAAVFSGLPGDESALIKYATDKFAKNESDGSSWFFQTAGEVISRSGDKALIHKTLATALNEKEFAGVWWKAAMLRGIHKGMRDHDGSMEILRGYGSRLLEMFSADVPKDLRAASIQLLNGNQEISEDQRNRIILRASQYLDMETDITLKEDALTILRLFPSKDSFQKGKQFVSASEPESIQLLAIQLMFRVSLPDAGTYFTQNWNEFVPALRKEILKQILKDRSTTFLFLENLENKQISPASIDWPQAVALMNHSDDSIRKKSRDLLAQQDLSEKDVLQKYGSILEKDGSHEKGRSIYTRFCASCHQIGQRDGIAFGPDLATIRNRDKRFILLDIVNPNRSIADGFELWVVHRKNGSQITGIIASQTSTSLTVRFADGKEELLQRGEIEKVVAIPSSGMPQGFGSSISPDEMNDLLAFLKKTDVAR